ncbi:MAG: DUF2177 family protein [Burkholderiales bacterium]
MSIKPYAIAYGAAALVFLALDATWLSTMASRLYRPLLGPLMLERPDLAAAVPFYLLYVLGVVVFCIAPALDTGEWLAAWWRGAFFGLVAYATYDLTNQATLQGWPWRLTLTDMAWGTLATSVAAAAGAWVALRWGR